MILLALPQLILNYIEYLPSEGNCQLFYKNKDKTVNITTKNTTHTIDISKFDRGFVATAVCAACFIHYKPIDNQVALYFNHSWWYNQNIYGDSSTIDLSLRFIYNENYNTIHNTNNHTESVLLASFIFTPDSTLWSSSTIDQITNETLLNLEQIHSLSDIQQFYLRTVVKH
ncbi:unnamed protein product [Rotaria sordida]|uniref:Uncharacterized protein n=1 Tax=Rotaria sordida TaxID=392033 RepID=A0A814D9B2_9BILA|nr:unnamed protein product [Rotaria sordida]CAF0895708.1 unnamed protein product [Rotaria sordida]CAF0950062.1 unnamed protein product [Rotaria sordida]CAF1036967.1 unnamed protein product [Rotaria sordida]CAF1180210.1 unnamed protein product [Rotaria sordida]